MSVCCEFVCCHEEVFATGRSLVQRSPTDCVSVAECGQVQQEHSAPTVGGYKGVRMTERELKKERISNCDYLNNVCTSQC